MRYNKWMANHAGAKERIPIDAEKLHNIIIYPPRRLPQELWRNIMTDNKR